jgi:hypothetical protein
MFSQRENDDIIIVDDIVVVKLRPHQGNIVLYNCCRQSLEYIFNKFYFRIAYPHCHQQYFVPQLVLVNIKIYIQTLPDKMYLQAQTSSKIH